MKQPTTIKMNQENPLRDMAQAPDVGRVSEKSHRWQRGLCIFHTFLIYVTYFL